MLAYVGSVVGLALIVGLALRTDFSALSQVWRLAGWSLLWLVPYRSFYFLCFALGWRLLLKPYPGADGLSLGYLWWVDPDTALAASLAKRMREVLCGLPSLISWQWLEVRHMRRSSDAASMRAA
jgi:hypothetical protein